MGQFWEEIPDNLIDWIKQQQIFWVATAPLQGDGHVNLSPKGISGCFHVVNPNQVWYEDLTGSGAETVSHLREPGNGRITILFQAFDGAPRILRLWGHGMVYEFGTPEYEAFFPAADRKPGSRAVIVIDVHKVGTSCGYGVPLYTFKSHRTRLVTFFNALEQVDRDAAELPSEKKGQGIKTYWAVKNTRSLDGLPGLRLAHETDKIPQNLWVGDSGSKSTEVAEAVASSSFKMSSDWINIQSLSAFSLGLAFATAFFKIRAFV